MNDIGFRLKQASSNIVGLLIRTFTTGEFLHRSVPSYSPEKTSLSFLLPKHPFLRRKNRNHRSTCDLLKTDLLPLWAFYNGKVLSN